MKHFLKLLTIFSLAFTLSGCDSGIFLPTSGGVSGKIKGTWKRYTYNESLGLTETWVIDGTTITSTTNRGGGGTINDFVSESSTYSVNTNLLSAFITINTDMHRSQFNREWEITTLKKDVMAFTSKDLPQVMLEFEKIK